jgi:hypothetical protein
MMAARSSKESGFALMADVTASTAIVARLDTGPAWHNLAHSLGIPANSQESPGTSKTLTNLNYLGNINDINGPKLASQAYDEGSIPFTRSN